MKVTIYTHQSCVLDIYFHSQFSELKWGECPSSANLLSQLSRKINELSRLIMQKAASDKLGAHCALISTNANECPQITGIYIA